MADKLGVLRDLQLHLQNARFPTDKLSTLSIQGDQKLSDKDLKLVQEFLCESVKIDNGPDAQTSQLYIACFWGLRDIVQKLLDMGVNCNKPNPGSMWTPLHAATFQENGPIVMMLLENHARPDIPDAEGRTPKDFASVSDIIWPHFAMLGLKRTSRVDLLEKKVIKRTSSGDQRYKDPANGIKMASYSRPDSGYAINSDPFVAAAATGDVLADVNDTDKNKNQPRMNIWK
ncbi:osteoclast-stimulating factor 1 isoform X1 [Patella vulgata]|uniref:osteoclast-stimulating factor 1 isoform X1 n=1 Tax=Patella vulgata TaxID=6465 RepID=UPI00217FF3DF|nr:osteoclast-stimulating factor 1 isoform X1 [Patella vulgata]